MRFKPEFALPAHRLDVHLYMYTLKRFFKIPTPFPDLVTTVKLPLQVVREHVDLHFRENCIQPFTLHPFRCTYSPMSNDIVNASPILNNSLHFLSFMSLGLCAVSCMMVLLSVSTHHQSRWSMLKR
jgi:hypothetical protein